jgi:hypothetical protein
VSKGKSKIAIQTRHSAPELSWWKSGESLVLPTEDVMQSEEITFIGKRGGALVNLAATAAICAAGVALLTLGYTIVGIVLLLGAVAPAIVSLRKVLVLPDVLEKLREWQQRYGHATTPSIGHTTTPSIGHTTTPSVRRRTA